MKKPKKHKDENKDRLEDQQQSEQARDNAAQPETVEGGQGNDLQQQLQQQQQQYQQLNDQYLRLYAEFDNARKRWDRDRQHLIKFGAVDIFRDFLVILDELEQALRVVEQQPGCDEIVKGLKMLSNNFRTVLQRHGVKPIEACGAKFDPHLHEIVASREVDDDNVAEHTVIEEAQKGYMFEDRILRTAKVIISVKPKKESEKEKES